MQILIDTKQSPNRKMFFIQQMRPVLRRGALFHDQAGDFLSPQDPEAFGSVTIWFRTGTSNVTSVILVLDGQDYEMQVTKSDIVFDYYSYTVKLTDQPVRYYFRITSGFENCIYDMTGIADSPREEYEFRLTPSFKTPDWAKGAVIYQIFTDRFYNGDPTNDVLTNEYSYIKENVQKIENWEAYPAPMDVREFYGGDLKGVWDKLDYLQELGVEVIYFNPLFVSPSNHKYDIQDYDYIDPHFGVIVNDEGELLKNGNKENRYATRYITRVTDKKNLEASNAFFAALVEEIHRRGMKVILDGVFNHCGSFNKWMDRECIYENAPGYEKGAYITEDSPYSNFFKFNDSYWPYNSHYNGWWGHDTLPKLNYEESPELYEYVMRIAKKWVSAPFCVDGWRLDVAADIGQSSEFNHKFWRDFRKAVKEENPDAIILAEHYGDPSPWLEGDQWDTVMNYDAFMEPVSWFLTGVEKHSDDFRPDMLGNSAAFIEAMTYNGSKFQGQSRLVAMNELSNHDHSRFMTRTNHKVGRTHTMGPEAAGRDINEAVFREAVVIQMTWAGAPTVYYGDEAGLCGWTDPDNRRAYPWGHENKGLIIFHKEIIRIHKENQALKTGASLMLHGEHNILVYGRFQGDNIIAVAVNNNTDTRKVMVDCWRLGLRDGEFMEQIFRSSEHKMQKEPEKYAVVNGRFTVSVPPQTAIVFRKMVKEDTAEEKKE